MKFSINQSALNDVLSTVSKAVNPRATNPALSGILMEAQENEVAFRATDLELSIQANAPALIEEDGKTLLPAKLLSDICSTLPDEAVNIEVTSEKAEILCGNSKFNIRTLNSTDYPEFPTVETNQKVTLPYAQVSKMTKKVARMIARDDAMPILQGINVSVNGKDMEFVATDTYRIAIAKAEANTENTSEFSAVIPGAFLMDIAGLKGDIQNAVISLSENQVVIECNDIVFINRRIAGNFPNYNQLMPQNPVLNAKINIKQLADAVRRISVLSLGSQKLTMSFDPATSKLNLSGSAADVGSCNESINVSFEGAAEQLEIAFNCNYVLDGLGCFDSDEITFVAESNIKPGLFKDAENITYILSPVK